MTSGMLLKSAVLLLLATFATSAVQLRNNPVADTGERLTIGGQLIENHDQNSYFQRVKRGWFDFFDSGNDDSTTTETPEAPVEFDDHERWNFGEDDQVRPTEWNYTAGEQTDYDDEIDLWNRTLSEYQNTRGNGEEHSGIEQLDAVSGGTTNDEGNYEVSRDINGRLLSSDFRKPILTVNEPSSQPGLEPSLESRNPLNIYRVTMLINETYNENLADHNTYEFIELHDRLSKALEQLYARALPDDYTRMKVLEFYSSPDQIGMEIYLVIESTSSDAELIRSILDDQLEIGFLGNIRVRPDNFRFISMQEFGFNYTTEIPDDNNNNDFDTWLVTTSEPEREVHCRGDQTIRCKDGSRCFADVQQCDGVQDCDDNSDEENCPPQDCPFGEVACDGSRCIKNEQMCNFVADCYDGTDESNCPPRPECAADEFRCQNGECIPRYLLCDQTADCYDRSDESNCSSIDTTSPMPTCVTDEFTCSDGQCVPRSARCNGVSDCRDAEDETNCPPPQRPLPQGCQLGEFSCDIARCIRNEQRCNFVEDCYDGTDELNCPPRPECAADEFRCQNGECIPGYLLCDQTPDCHDRSDESNCSSIDTTTPMPTCATDEFTCSDGQCIPRSARCNGVSDCRDAEDETNCPPPQRPPPQRCQLGEFSCDISRCIRNEQRCNFVEDCYDGTDELNCPPRPGCATDEFRCQNGECIPGYLLCDRIPDCYDRSDESNCPSIDTTSPIPTCATDEFTCSDGQCIPRSARCNGVSDCRDAEDETNCPSPQRPPPQRCGRGEIQCRNRNCVREDAQCNGFNDCGDNSDEENCVPSCLPGEDCEALNLRTYPTDQNITEKETSEGQEVVMMCRDESLRRAQVHWFRENGAPLPLGSTDRGGRLEIPNVKVSDSGNYVCEALGISENTPGRRVYSHLTVTKQEKADFERPPTCRVDQATCSNGECIPKSRVCDGRHDCTDGTDESGCAQDDQRCQPNQFRCANKQCVSKIWRCDGDKDCLDGSDEENCAPPPPGSPCNSNEYQCASGDQCILKSFQCDTARDCFDGSDEVGCTKVQILTPPPRMMILNEGETFIITCTALGMPIPEINWRLNWGHIPEKCTTTSINGTSTLTCPSIAIEDQGAYSCEAMNTLSWEFATPDTILQVFRPDIPDVCPSGTFNSLATTADECISCFCFGVATQCHSADLFTYQLPAPFDQYNVALVEMYPGIRIIGEVSGNVPEIRPIGRNGVHVIDDHSDGLNINVLYFALPESYRGSQLKSYGGYLKYTVRSRGQGRPNDAPSVILAGNNYLLVHRGQDVPSDYETERSVRFFFGEWVRIQGRDEVTASREEIMMALANVENILIKVQYIEGPIVDTTLTNVLLDTAGVRNTNQGAATFVEECRCPAGYTGLSCEHCASGYIRRDSGPWLGQCHREEPTCQPGYYRDPSRNIPCQPCPCPLTNPSNQFARTCHLGSDGQPTCDCPQGYVGRRCEQCAPGYQGNPLSPGDSCVMVGECDPSGSISPYPDPATGVCQCKMYATGRTCNQCKANAFNLATTNKFGCASCFCMGITSKCTSSNWYRSEIRVAFTSSIRDFSLVESESVDLSPIVDGIHLNKIDREIVYESFPNSGNNEVYYWQLPSIFLGDRLASYGGYLRYTVRYVPSPGGGRSRNNAADVELISPNLVSIRHFTGKQLEPNTAETITVPLLEDYWQRSDGTVMDREQFLMALADVQSIRIKATYTTSTDQAALSSVSLDTAVDSNTGKARAIEVEQCSCPPGYRGLSCEDCDVGYTRELEGIYLGKCVPCNCNGHSTQCDAETGICEYCRDHTTGDSCEVCKPGYEGDATRGTPQDCTPAQSGGTEEPPCACDPAGSLRQSCYEGQCDCKTNVVGPQCNRCRQSTFGLSAKNVDGCNKCYCSGVTNQCHESSLFIDQIPIIIYDSTHGLTLTDSNHRDVITQGFDVNAATNELGYRYPDSRSQRLFWSLPFTITGNQVKSYGGYLNVSQHIITRPGAVNERDHDVLLIGNGITLYWTNPEVIRPGIPLAYSVPLVESSWTRLTPEGGLRSASRADLMNVLSNLEAILVRATHSSEMEATYISDISLDTASTQLVSNRRATQVEDCRCPFGYTGTSCEICAPGYYRDINDRSRSPLGACKYCPCSGNQQKCEVDGIGGVKCHCLPGWSGVDCSESDFFTTTEISTTDLPPPRIIVTISENPIQIVEIGSTVTYHCSGRSEDRNTVQIEWQKESGELPIGRSYDDTQGILVIRDLRVSDSGTYVCQVTDGVNISYQNLSLTVEDTPPTKPRPVIEPRYLTAQEGNPVEFLCKASGHPPPRLSWIRVQGEMNPVAVFENGIWRLPAARKSDEAEYKCIAENSAGTTELRTVLYVTANAPPPPQPSLPVIEPANWVGRPTDTVRLVCTAPRGARITWTRSGNAPLPASAVEQDGILTIYNPSPADAGYYICTAISYEGVETTSSAIVRIESAGPLSIKVAPERQEVSQGSVAEVKCIVTGDPTTVVTWTKLGETTLGAHVQTFGNTLRITNTQVSDRGIYVCHASNSGGNAQGSAMIDVNRREVPIIELYPLKNQIVRIGGSALLQCRLTAGVPAPSVTWARQDGKPFSSNVQQLAAGVLQFRNVTLEDEGTFICSATNEVGSTSLTAILEISTPPMISITPEPNNGLLSVRLGETVRLTCTADGQPTPTVSWVKHKSGVSQSTPQWKALLPVAVYEILSVSYEDEGSYSCFATNSYGPIEERIQIRINDRWERPDEPAPRPNSTEGGVRIPEEFWRIADGGKAEMRCEVYSSNQEDIYLDWKRNDGRSLPQRSTVRGGILIIDSVTKDDAGEYICQGLNSYGQVVFTATSYLEIIFLPRIELDPIQQSVLPGESPSVNCRVTGDQPIEIEWHAIDRPLPYSVTQDHGILQFNGITSADAGKYVCRATNRIGTAEAVAQVLVTEYNQPEVVTNQRDVDTFVGSSVRLECPTDSSLRVNWSKEGGDIPRNARISGNVLTLDEVRPEDSGKYICQVSNQHDDSSRNYINLRVQSQTAPSNIRVRASQDLINIGDTIQIQCDAPELRGARLSWTRVNEPSLPRNAQTRGGVLRLNKVDMADSGVYRCTANTPEGRFDKDYKLIIQGGNNDAPAVETKSAPYKSRVVMNCNADIEPPIRFQWHKLGGRLPVDSRTSDNQLELPAVTAEDAGTYICTANNGRVNIEVPQVLVVTNVVPHFTQANESYISFAPLPDASLQFNIDVSFKPESYDGTILYNGQYTDGTGDFLSLALVGGYPEFRFDLGSSPAVIRGQRPISLGQWHTIKLQRDRKEGSMMVDGEGPYRGSAGGRFLTLDLSEPLYIGGVPDYNQISQQANVRAGFVGCISRVVIGENQLDLNDDLLSRVGVTTCETCAENPCSNNGVCQEAATDNGYTCLCPAGYGGKHCTNTGQACYPGACGEGTCYDKEDGFVCSCPIGKSGSKCEVDIQIEVN